MKSYKDMDPFLSSIITSLKLNGIATAQVSDGRMLFLSRERVASLLKTMDEEPSDYVSIFIKNPDSDEWEFKKIN